MQIGVTKLMGRESAMKEIINTSLIIYLLKQYKIGYSSVLSTHEHSSKLLFTFHPSQKLMKGFCLGFSLLLQSQST